MNFYLFDPGTLDPEASRRGLGCQNLAFQRFDPMILCSFLWRIRWTTLEDHSSKQMMVYGQITFFITSRNFQNLILWWKWFPGHVQTVPDLEKPRKWVEQSEKPEKSPSLLSAMAGPIGIFCGPHCLTSLAPHGGSASWPPWEAPGGSSDPKKFQSNWQEWTGPVRAGPVQRSNWSENSVQSSPEKQIGPENPVWSSPKIDSEVKK